MLKKYFYKLLAHYLSLYIRPDNSLWDINPTTNGLVNYFEGAKTIHISTADRLNAEPLSHKIENLTEAVPEYMVLNGNIHYEKDIETLFSNLHQLCTPTTRVVVTYYSSLWKPFMRLATFLGLREKSPELNWVAHEDLDNFMRLTDFELIRRDSKVLMPVYIPLLSSFLNQFLAPLPFFRWFTMVNIAIARPVKPTTAPTQLAVSIVVPARNEAGNIENIIQSIPPMNERDEIIFIEGNSTDNTWEVIEEMHAKYQFQKNIIIAKQAGKGKADAVRKGFSLAKNDILMILDADLTVPAADLPKFYKAISLGKGEFINGSRLVYPMEKEAMRFFNILGNKFFALGFSFVLGQRFKDTLCGTKVISRENYYKLTKYRSFFGDFDPFGDFDLIFGAARLGLKIVEVPITYKERTYGSTNIQRWKHGAILLRMLLFAARKFKFI
jgi:hypothetical protein